jgi:hypothetical protein
MENIPAVLRAQIRTPAVFFSSAGLALVSSFIFSIFASNYGFLFSGNGTFSVLLVTTPFCAITTSITATVFKRIGRHFSWRAIVIETVILSLLAVIFLSRINTQQTIHIFFAPGPVPSQIHIYQGRGRFFDAYVHFSATPADIAAAINAKELVEVPEELPEQGDFSNDNERQRAITPWDWWQPATMTNPRFFFRHHTSEAIQGWSEGWWINGATNEVYAFISG